MHINRLEGNSQLYCHLSYQSNGENLGQNRTFVVDDFSE